MERASRARGRTDRRTSTTLGPLTGNLAERAGLVVIEGTEKQIDDLRTSEEFRARLNRVCIIGHNVQVTLCETGDAMVARMQRYGKSLMDTLG